MKICTSYSSLGSFTCSLVSPRLGFQSALYLLALVIKPYCMTRGLSSLMIILVLQGSKKTLFKIREKLCLGTEIEVQCGYCLQKQYSLPISKSIQIAIQPGEVLQSTCTRGGHTFCRFLKYAANVMTEPRIWGCNNRWSWSQNWDGLISGDVLFSDQKS